MRNLPEYVVAFWGAALNGAIVVPLNAWWAGGELDYALRDAGVTVLFADDERVARVPTAACRRACRSSAYAPTSGDVALDDLIEGDAIADGRDRALRPRRPDRPHVHVGDHRPAQGRAHHEPGDDREPLEHGVRRRRARRCSPGGRPLPRASPRRSRPRPMFHIGGVSSIVGGPMGGSKIVIMRKWDVDEALRLAREEQVTGFGGVPTMARQILEHPRITELGIDIRSCPMGGAAVPPDLPLRAVEVFGPGVQILNGYGGTETTSAVVTNVGFEYEARPDFGRAVRTSPAT